MVWTFYALALLSVAQVAFGKEFHLPLDHESSLIRRLPPRNDYDDLGDNESEELSSILYNPHASSSGRITRNAKENDQRPPFFFFADNMDQQRSLNDEIEAEEALMNLQNIVQENQNSNNVENDTVNQKERYLLQKRLKMTGMGLLGGNRKANNLLNSAKGLMGSSGGLIGSSRGLLNSQGFSSSNSNLRSPSTGLMSSNGRMSSSKGLVGSSNGLMGSSSGLTGPSSGLMGSSRGLIGSDNGLMGSSRGLIGSSNGVMGSSNGLMGSSRGLIGSNRDLSGSSTGLMGSSSDRNSPATGLMGSSYGLMGSSRGFNGLSKGLLGSSGASKGLLGSSRLFGGTNGLLGSSGTHNLFGKNRQKGLVLSIDLGIKALRDAIMHAKVQQKNRQHHAQAQKNMRLLHNIGKRTVDIATVPEGP